MRILQVFAWTVMVIPSDAVIRAIGAQGYAAGLVGMFAFTAFVAATLLGLHNPLRRRHPVRGALLTLWLSVLVSYILMGRETATEVEVRRGSDAHATGHHHRSGACRRGVPELVRDVRRVLRALSWGGAFCGVVASLQYWISLDITPLLRSCRVLGELRQPGDHRARGVESGLRHIDRRDRARRGCGDAAPAHDLSRDLRQTIGAPQPMGSRRADRGRYSYVRVPLGGHLGRAWRSWCSWS